MNTNGVVDSDIGTDGGLTVEHSFIGHNDGTSLAETGTTATDTDGNFIGGSIGGAIDPLLATLADNGGPTMTHVLLPGSLAINHGDNALAVDPTNGNAALTTDQRGVGFPRLVGSMVDIGAFEDAGADTPSITNSSTQANTQSTSGLVIGRNAADGAEVTHFRISSITDGTLFLNDGITQINDGDFITFVQANAGLRFTPAINSLATGHFTVDASTSNSIAGIGGSSVVADITVAPAPIGTSGDDAFVLIYSSTSTAGTVTVNVSTDGGPITSLGTFPMNAPLTLMGQSGTDSVRVVGTSGNDLIDVGASGLTVNGAGLILDSIENRILAGATGDDTYRFDADTPLGLFTVIETAGIDSINLSPTSSSGVSINLGLTGIQVVNASLSLKLNSGSRFEHAVGGSRDDILTGNSLANRLTGNSGNDRLAGAQTTMCWLVHLVMMCMCLVSQRRQKQTLWWKR